MADADLIQRVRGAATEDERHGAFMAIYDRYLRDVAGVCGRLLREMDSAKDATQDTFTAAYKDLCHTQTEVRDLGRWLRGIARNRCGGYMRGGSPGRGHRQGLDLLLLDDHEAGSSADIAWASEPSRVTPALPRCA